MRQVQKERPAWEAAEQACFQTGAAGEKFILLSCYCPKVIKGTLGALAPI